MKKWITIIGWLVLLLCSQQPLMAQSQEVQQLLLNVEKLAQFKKILQNMYDGYRALEQGYNKVRDITNGNYKLHQVFLDGLLAVSPIVRNYYKIAIIIDDQVQIVKEYKQAFSMFRDCNMFSTKELRYLEDVYKGLFDESLANLDALLTIVTAGKVRMSDDERLKAIDQLHNEMNSKLTFMREFNNSAHILALQRVKEHHEIEATRRLHGIE